jgi:hypothetical protein
VSRGFLVINQVDNQLGKIVFAFSLLAPTPPISGDGILVWFEIRGYSTGSSEIKLDQVILASADGQPLPFRGIGGVANILPTAGSATPGNTPGQPYVSPTSRPTQVPLPTLTPVESPTPARNMTQSVPNPATPVIISSTAHHIPSRDTAGEIEGTPISQKPPISTPDQYIAGEDAEKTKTEIINTTSDASKSRPDTRQETWFIYLAILLAILLIAGMIFWRQKILRVYKKANEDIDSD